MEILGNGIRRTSKEEIKLSPSSMTCAYTHSHTHRDISHTSKLDKIKTQIKKSLNQEQTLLSVGPLATVSESYSRA